MENSPETYEQYQYALKRGKKTLRHNRWHKLNEHLEVLDEIVNIHECVVEQLGEIDVPADLIVGTKTSARALSFSSDFMPLMWPTSEFGSKWRQVCEYHLSDTGINEAPTAYEYLGKFYIEEGNKRVSVLKSYNAVQITLDVIRLIPPKTNNPIILRYYEFLDFYKLSRLYSIQFIKAGYYKKLQRLLGFSDEHIWTRKERIETIGIFQRLSEHLDRNKITYSHSDCFVAMLELYGFEDLLAMKDKELDKAINANRTRLSYGYGPFKIMCLADEENSLLYSEHVKKQLEDVDLVISCGDLEPEYLEYIVTMANKDLLYVHGNHDYRYDEKPPLGCVCIDDDVYVYQGIKILGLGGSFRYSQDKYQYTEVQMKYRISKIKKKIRKLGGVDIVVTHAPIKGYGDLEDYAHQGFECYKELLKDLHPKYWLYGHVHLNYDYNAQRVIEYKNTKIVNCYDKYEITL